MDEIIKKILRQVKKSEYIKAEMMSLWGFQCKRSKHLVNMRKSLQKHSRLGILPHDCEYYHWVPSK